MKRLCCRFNTQVLSLLIFLAVRSEFVEVSGFCLTCLHTIHRRRGTGHTLLHADPSNVSRQDKPRKKKFSKSRNSQNRPRNNGSANYQKSKELNAKVIECEDAKGILGVLAATKGVLTSPAGGGILTSVNFSTAIHRVARHLSYQRGKEARYSRASILADPRFALFLCSLSEALADIESNTSTAKPIIFKTREMSNICWAIAKMKIAPPQESMQLTPRGGTATALMDTSSKLRGLVMQVAKARQDNEGDDEASPQVWVPTLSFLCGVIMDTISSRANQGAESYALQEKANLLWAFATAQRADQQAFDNLCNSMIESMRQSLQNQQEESILQPQEWTNSIWAFATAQITSDGQEELLSFVADLLDGNPEFIGKFKPQEMSNAAWGVATILSNKKATLGPDEQHSALRILRHIAQAMVERAGEFKTQELSNTAWAFATVGFGLSGSQTSDPSMNDYVVIPTDDAKGDETMMTKAVDAIIETALPRLSRFRSQELNNFAWSLSRLNRGGPSLNPVLEGIGMELCDKRRYVTSQDVGTTMWAFASLNFFNDHLYRCITSRLTSDQARYCKPQEISNTLWALATADILPVYPDAFDTSVVPQSERPRNPLTTNDSVTNCFGIGARELMKRPHHFKTQEIKDVLWSFSKVGMRHPALFKAIGEHLVGTEEEILRNAGRDPRARGLDDFSPQGVGNLAWAYARQGQLIEDVHERIQYKSTAAVATGRLGVYTTIFCDIGETVVKQLFSSMAETDIEVHGGLSKLKPQDLSNTAWAFAVLGLRHTQFMEKAKEQLLLRTNQYLEGRENSMTSFKCQELANLLWSFATLNCAYPEVFDVLSAYMERLCGLAEGECSSRAISRQCKRQELANIAWSCAVVGTYPLELMRFLYAGLVGVDGENDPALLKEYYGDGGLQRQAIMTLIYVQIAMEMEMDGKPLSLPDNFPDGWGQKSASNTRMSEVMTERFDLALSTSKIQREVADAFHRISFDHDEELVISTKDLQNNHNIMLTSTPMEVLSLDIANADKMVAVEVDGPAHFLSVIDNPPVRNGYAAMTNRKLEYRFNWNGDEQEINGPTALKTRLLEGLGWRIIQLPFWEWYALNGESQEQEAYCRKLIE